VRWLAALLSIWTAWRWVGFAFGAVRLRWFTGPTRREARRTVINRGAINVFLSVASLFLWAESLQLRMSQSFVGFLAAAMMCSLAIGVAAAFMQPEERTPQTVGICRFAWPGGPRPSTKS
jgi:hypothetical protein